MRISSEGEGPWATAATGPPDLLLGTGHFERTQCTGPDYGGDCDLAMVEGILWAGVAIVLEVAAGVVTLLLRAFRRRR